MNTVTIHHPDDPRVAPYRAIRDAHLRADRSVAPGGLFVAEGEVVVRTLLDSPYPVASVLTTEARLGTVGDALERLDPTIPVLLASQMLMDDIAGFHIHRGLLAAGIREPLWSLDTLLGSQGPLVVLDALANHDNVGGAFRNAAAFGASGVLLTPDCADPLYRKALRVSVGHALRVPYTQADARTPLLDRLRDAGWTLVALANTPGARPIGEVASDLSGERVAVLLGAEGPGLSDACLERAHEVARIPIRPDVDSLNAGTALGIALFCLAAE